MISRGERAVQCLAVAAYSTTCVYAYVGALIGWPNLIEWIYAHETLTAGFLAVGSALVGAWLLHRQTTLSNRQEDARIRRRREAIRTVLPLTLSDIARYAEASAAATKAILDQCVDEGLPVRSELTLPDAPPLPEGAVLTLKELVETFEIDETISIATLLADLQVQNSRLSGAISDAGRGGWSESQLNLEEYMIDCAMIYARCGSLFDYARRASEDMSADFTWSKVQSALLFFGLYSGRYDRVFKTIDRRSNGDLDAVVPARWSALGK